MGSAGDAPVPQLAALDAPPVHCQSNYFIISATRKEGNGAFLLFLLKISPIDGVEISYQKLRSGG